jgi:hypothetical protein
MSDREYTSKESLQHEASVALLKGLDVVITDIYDYWNNSEISLDKFDSLVDRFEEALFYLLDFTGNVEKMLFRKNPLSFSPLSHRKSRSSFCVLLPEQISLISIYDCLIKFQKLIKSLPPKVSKEQLQAITDLGKSVHLASLSIFLRETNVSNIVKERLSGVERKKVSKSAADARYSLIREFKHKAAVVARCKWEEGSELTHDKMVKFLIEEYKDSNGKYPFISLPDAKKSQPENVLRDVVKNVAKEMNRPDLIRGNKKMK